MTDSIATQLRARLLRRRLGASAEAQRACVREVSFATCACVLLVALLLSMALADEPAPAPPADLLARAQALVDAGKAAEAEPLLLQAAQAAPADLATSLALAKLYETLGRKENALDWYGRVLSDIDPQDPTARERFSRLCYQGRFPRWLRAQHLPHSPVTFMVEQVRLSADSGEAPAARLVGYTTSLLFPESLSGGERAPWVRLPASTGVFTNVMYNRVVYGMIAGPGSEVLQARWMLGYPSATILPSAADYSHLAGRLMRLLLHADAYLQGYLGLEASPSEADLYRVFLTEEGFTGAEQVRDKIFFYDVDHDRGGAEWLRETFHELGHMFLPRVGPFPGEDRWGNGDLGERLLFQWLLEEAGAIAGEPWPSHKAAEALDHFWRVGVAAARRHLVDNCRLPLNAWLATAPEDFEGEDAFLRFVGFCLWVQAAHGRHTLATVLRSATGTAPADFVAAYKRCVASVLAAGELRIAAGALNPPASQLAQTPREGAVRREHIFLAQNDSASFRVYLPGGRWAVMLEHTGGAEAQLVVSADEGAPLSGAKAVDLGEVADGWHELLVTCQSPGTVELLGLRLQPAGGAE